MQSTISVLRACLFVVLSLLPLPAHADNRPRQIGVITALSGGMATIGGAVRNGIELAREEHPEAFKDLQFAYEDDQFDAKLSLSAYRNLKNSRSPFVLLGFGTILPQAIGPLIEKDRLPFINFTFEAAPAIGKPHIIRAMNHTNQYMGALATHLSRHDVVSFPLIQTEATFFNAMVGSLERALGDGKSIEVVARINPTETDFRAVITKLRSRTSPVVGVFLWPDQLLAFFRQAREMGLKAEYFGTDLCETAAFIAKDDNLAEGCVYADNEVSEDFRSGYRAKFGNEAQLTFAGSAYDMTVLVGDILSDEKVTTSQAMLSALAATKNRKGVLGTFSFREEASVGKFFDYPVRVKRIEGRRGVPVP